MSTNSHSEAVWQVLHQATALLNDGGFAAPVPPLPASAQGGTPGPAASGEGYNDLAARYGEHLEFGTVWPAGTGSSRPQALILCDAPLSPEAYAFVRTWFENPRVNLVLDQHFFLQPLPVFSAGPKPPFPGFVRDLCGILAPKVLLSLGASPAQKLLGAPLSLETLQGSDYRFDKWTMVTTLDPERFTSLDDVEKTKFKGQVWRDLQRLLGKMKYG